MPRCHIKVDDLPSRYQDQVRTQLAALAPRRAPREREQDQPPALEHQDRSPALLADPGGTLFVRIVRVGGRTMDSDNVPAGYKALRDSIASAVGRQSDSEADGWQWEYDQEPGEIGTRIEIYEVTHA